MRHIVDDVTGWGNRIPTWFLPRRRALGTPLSPAVSQKPSWAGSRRWETAFSLGSQKALMSARQRRKSKAPSPASLVSLVVYLFLLGCACLKWLIVGVFYPLESFVFSCSPGAGKEGVDDMRAMLIGLAAASLQIQQGASGCRRDVAPGDDFDEFSKKKQKVDLAPQPGTVWCLLASTFSSHICIHMGMHLHCIHCIVLVLVSLTPGFSFLWSVSVSTELSCQFCCFCCMVVCLQRPGATFLCA